MAVLQSVERARRSAEAAGVLLRERFGRAEVLSQTGRDIKLAEDRAAQDLIVGALRQGGSEPILTEESGWIGEPPAAGQAYWVVDPLDGSYNFVSGIPLCCVAVALCRDDEPLAGCVHDFLHGETFTAEAEGPLRLNDRTLAPVQRPAAVLATGFPVAGDHQAATVARQIAQWRKLRMLGSAALSLAWVAAGRIDGYEEDGIRWWDVAAGLALVRGSGGQTAAEGVGADASARLVGRWHVRAMRAGLPMPRELAA